MTERRTLRLGPDAPFRRLVGVGGIGSGMFLELEGDATLGRNESRAVRLLDVRDYCKLHIVAHHVAVLLGAEPSGSPFHVLPVGKVGSDQTGRGLVAEMRSAGIDTTYVDEVADRPTLFSVCFQYADGAGGNLTTVDSAAAALDEGDVDRVEPLIAESAGRTIVLAAPEVGLPARRRLLELGTAHGAFRVAAFTSSEVEDARDTGMLGLADLVSMNEEEAALLAGRELDPAEPSPFLDAVAAALAAGRTGARAIVTAGADGAFAYEEGRWERRRPPRTEVMSTAGAGDALLGGVVAGIAAGAPLTAPLTAPMTTPTRPEEGALRSALDLGIALAALSVTSPHTIHPGADLETLMAFVHDNGLAFAPPLSDALEP
jgi:ribokinase